MSKGPESTGYRGGVAALVALAATLTALWAIPEEPGYSALGTRTRGHLPTSILAGTPGIRTLPKPRLDPHNLRDHDEFSAWLDSLEREPGATLDDPGKGTVRFAAFSILPHDQTVTRVPQLGRDGRTRRTITVSGHFDVG